MQVLNLDQYLSQKEKNATQLFVFFLDGEYPHINADSTWLHELRYPTYLVRMNEEEFHSMDISIHPKVFCTKKGKELFSINGFASLNYLKFKIQNLLR